MKRFSVLSVLSVVLLVLSALGVMSAPASAEGGPAFVSSEPADNAVIKNSPAPPAGPIVSATFDEALDPTSTITVKDNTGTLLAGTKSFSDDKKTIIFTPASDLTEAGSAYVVNVVAKRETLTALTTEKQFSFSIDNTAPAKPSIVSIEGDGTSPAAGNDTTPTIVVGSVSPGETVSVYDDGIIKGSKVVPANNTQVTFNAVENENEVTVTGDTSHSITAKTTDAAGNTSDASAPFVYTLDTAPPAAPVIASIEGDSSTPAAGNDATPMIVVNNVTAGDVVKIFEGATQKASKVATSDSVTFNAVESGTGSNDVTVTGQGDHTLTAKAADQFGNNSAASPAFVYSLDTVAPAAPAIDSVEGDTTSPAAGADTTPTIVVSGVVAGDTVRIFDGDVEKASKVVPPSATTVTFNAMESEVAPTLSGTGDHVLRATSTDAVGNSSPSSAAFTYALDTTGAAPQVMSTNPADGHAGQPPATVSATYSEALDPAKSTLTLKNKNNNDIAGTVTFSDDGKTITFTPATPLNDAGSPYTATATVTDLEGNAAQPTVWTFSVDTTPPPAPVISSVHGDSTSPATGNDTTPAVRVTGVTAGDRVKLFDGATEKATLTVPAGATEVVFNSGSAADATLTGDGSHSLTAKAIDQRNNVSPASAAFVYDLDTAAPGAPAINQVEGDTTTPATGTDATPTVEVGSVTAGHTVKVFDGATEIASKVVPTGATSVTFNAAENETELSLTGDGAHPLKAFATDPAGNTSSASPTFTYNLDAAGPALVSTSPANGSTVKPPATVSATYGEAVNQATSTISVTKNGGGAVAGATSYSNDGKTIVFTPSAPLTQADGPYAVEVAAKDAVGNTTNTAFNFAVDTTAPATPTITSVEGDTTSPASGEDTTPTIVVSGVTAGDTVKLFDGATQKGSKVVPTGATTVTFNTLESDSDAVLSGAGNHSLTATSTDPAGNASAASPAFVYQLIVKVTPTVKSVDPASGPRADGGVVWITGTNFTNDAVPSFSGTGITVENKVVESSTRMGVAIAIAENAPLGARDVTVSIPEGNSGTCVGCFTVTPAQGYTMAGEDGSVYSFGASTYHGDAGDWHLNAPIIGISHTSTGNGYWLVARDGGIFSFGDAAFHGSMGAAPLNAPVLGMEPTPTGNGYWLFAADGGIFSFGDAAFYGSMGGHRINAPVVGMASTSDGKGYWLVAQDGGIFSFGNAPFHGSTGGMTLAEPVFDMAAAPNNSGYWLVARDGGIFAFGNAPFYGSAAEAQPATVIGMGTTPTGKGYWIADRDGFVYEFGDATFLGDLEDVPLPAPIAGFAVSPAAAG